MLLHAVRGVVSTRRAAADKRERNAAREGGPGAERWDARARLIDLGKQRWGRTYGAVPGQRRAGRERR